MMQLSVRSYNLILLIVAVIHPHSLFLLNGPALTGKHRSGYGQCSETLTVLPVIVIVKLHVASLPA